MASLPGLQCIDDEQQDERDHQHHHRHGCGACVVVLLQLANDDEGRDFRHHGDVACNEDDRAVFAHRPRKCHGKAGEQRGSDGGQDDLGEGLKTRGTEAQAAEFVAKLYKNVPVLAKGGRDATATFLQRNIGDVLITFESEVVSIDREFGVGKVDSVYPSVSVVAENPVAVVERTVAKKGTAQLAKAYLDYLYSDEAQEIAAKHAIRPRSEAVLKKHAATFKPLKQFTVAKYFGSLTEAQKVHFNDGGQFDKIYSTK